MATQRDVARRAGISIATVSRCINQKGYISPRAKARVDRAIRDLKYKPNLVARSLKVRSSRVIGLIFPDIENPFFISLIKKAEEVAQRHGYNVFLCNTENKPEKEVQYIEMLKGKLVDGYIIIPSITTGSSLKEVIRGEKVVFLDRRIEEDPGRISVKLDNRKAIRIAVEHLAGLGHRRIGAVCVPVSVTTGAERLAGFREAARKLSLPVDETLIAYADFSVESARQRTRELLTISRRPTALVPMSGPTTIGALKAIRELDLRIPDDVSLISFDESPFDELFTPPLTTVAQPAYEFAARGTELLLSLLRGEKVRQRLIVLDPIFIERDSCRRR